MRIMFSYLNLPLMQSLVQKLLLDTSFVMFCSLVPEIGR
jgi:hypothetical protein